MRLIATFSAIVFASLSSISVAHDRDHGKAELQYRLVDLGKASSVPEGGFGGVSLNNRGEVAGADTNDQLATRAYLWRRGRFHDLGVLGTINGLPVESLAVFQINDDTEIVS